MGGDRNYLDTALQGAGTAVGSVPLLGDLAQVLQKALVGPGGTALTPSDQLVRALTTGVVGGNNPGAIPGLWSAYNEADQAAAKVIQSPEFQAATPAQQKAMLPPGYKAPDLTKVAPPAAKDIAAYEKSTAEANAIRAARLAYESALNTGDQNQISVALANYRKTVGMEAPAGTAGAVLKAEIAGAQRAGLDTTGATASIGPAGGAVSGLNVPRPTIPSAPAPAPMGPPPIGAAPSAEAQPTLPVGPENVGVISQAARSQTDMPRGVMFMDFGNGNIRPARMIQTSKGTAWQAMTDEEFTSQRREQAVADRAAAKVLETESAKIKGALSASQGLAQALRPMVEGVLEPGEKPAFPMAKTPEKADLGYSWSQITRAYLPPSKDNAALQRFQAQSVHGLALLAQSLGMRAGPQAVRALADSLYHYGDSAEQVYAKLDNLGKLKEAQLQSWFVENGFQQDPSIQPVDRNSAAVALGYQPGVSQAAQAAHGAAVEGGPGPDTAAADIAAILRRRKGR